MGKTGQASYTVATEADLLEQTIAAAGLDEQEAEQVFDVWITGGLSAAERRIKAMTVAETERTAAEEAMHSAADRYRSAVVAIDQEEKRALYDEQGAPRLMPAEQQRQREQFASKRQQHLASFREETARHEAENQALRESADQVLAKLARRPVEYLAGEDLQTASARDRFVERDTAAQSLAQLADQARAALARGDRVAAALLATHLPIRIATEREQAAEKGNWRPQPALAELGDLVKELEASLLSADDKQRRARALRDKEKADRQLETLRRIRQAHDPEQRAALARRFGIREY